MSVLEIIILVAMGLIATGIILGIILKRKKKKQEEPNEEEEE